jgi:hypothetical protein
VTGLVYCCSFGIIETCWQRQFMNSGLLRPQRGAMVGGCACDLPTFIDGSGMQGQGDYFVMFRKTTRAVALSDGPRIRTVKSGARAKHSLRGPRASLWIIRFPSSMHRGVKK